MPMDCLFLFPLVVLENYSVRNFLCSVTAGDILVKPDSNETYRVGSDTATLKGVYNVNKGYAVFKQIDILYQSKEYTIVKTGTSYGISLYDHIALDGAKINEDDLLK